MMIHLGFKAGKPPENYIKHLIYNKKWNKANRLKGRKYEAKYRSKLRSATSTTTNRSRYLWAAEKQLLRLKLRKENANAAYKKMLQLLKMFPTIHNRRYHLKNLSPNSSRPLHSPKL